MASTFLLEIVTPERKFFAEEIQEIILKTIDGEIGILKGHIPLLAAVEIGNIRILKANGEWIEAFVSKGFMEVTKEKSVLLTDSALWPGEIDEHRASAAKERAQERLQTHLSKIEYIRTQAALNRAIARLKVKKGIR